MPRIRTIKPIHHTDKGLAGISLQAHLLWVLNWCFSDDEGVFENDPLLIRSNNFPRRTDIRVEQIQQWLDQLAKARYIIPFTYQNEGYFINRTFKTHQRIDKPQPSKIPSEIIQRMISECSTNDLGPVAPDSIGEEGKGKEVGADKPPTTRKVFEIPIQDEVRQYFVSIMGNTQKPGCWPADKCFFQADKMLDHYTSNGWIQAKGKKIVDWKAACRNWIRNAVEGTFSSEIGTKVQKNGTDVQKTDAVVPKLDKLAAEINFLYGTFREDPARCTVISVDAVHYDYLKKSGRISFSPEQTESIKQFALQAIRGKGLEETAEKQKVYMKKFGVLEFFDKLEETGVEVVFHEA